MENMQLELAILIPEHSENPLRLEGMGKGVFISSFCVVYAMPPRETVNKLNSFTGNLFKY